MWYVCITCVCVCVCVCVCARMHERERERQTERGTQTEKKVRDRQRDGDTERDTEIEKKWGREKKICQAHIILQNVQDAAWNETSHPKLVHIYLLSHRTIPAIQSNKDIHNTQLNHIFTQSIVIFHTAHRATGSSSLVVYSKQYRISAAEGGIINTIHINTHVCACMLPWTNAHQHTHVHKHVCAQEHTQQGTEKIFRHVVTKRARVTKCAGCASNLTHFVTLVTKLATTRPLVTCWMFQL